MNVLDNIQQFFSRKQGIYTALAFVSLFGLFVIYTAVAQMIPFIPSWSISSSALSESPGAAGAIISASKSEKSLNVKQLVEWNLFGKTLTSINKFTSKAIELTGIFMSTDQKTAGAVIHIGEDGITENGIKAQTETVYAVGDTIPGGQVVKKILVDRVVLEQNGALRSIFIPKETTHDRAIKKGSLSKKTLIKKFDKRRFPYRKNPLLDQLREQL